LRFNTAPLGAVHSGGAGDLFPRIRKPLKNESSIPRCSAAGILYFGTEPEFTHNIEILLDRLKKFTDIPENIKEATKMTIYAVQTRYPGEYDEVMNEEYLDAIKMSKECLEWVEKVIAINEKKNKGQARTKP